MRDDDESEFEWDGGCRSRKSDGLDLTPAERLRWLEEVWELTRSWNGTRLEPPRGDPDARDDSWR